MKKNDKGRLGIKNDFYMSEAVYSKQLSAGAKTYFFDIRETQSGDRYLQITESRLKQDGERYRSNIVFLKNILINFKEIEENL